MKTLTCQEKVTGHNSRKCRRCSKGYWILPRHMYSIMGFTCEQILQVLRTLVETDSHIGSCFSHNESHFGFPFVMRSLGTEGALAVDVVGLLLLRLPSLCTCTYVYYLGKPWWSAFAVCSLLWKWFGILMQDRLRRQHSFAKINVPANSLAQNMPNFGNRHDEYENEHYLSHLRRGCKSCWHNWIKSECLSPPVWWISMSSASMRGG